VIGGAAGVVFSIYLPTVVEGLIIVHTAWVGWRTWNLIDKIGYDLGTGSPRGTRTEHRG